MLIKRYSILNILAGFNRPARLFLLAALLDGVIFSAWLLFFNFYILERGFSREFLGLITSTTSAAALLLGIPLGMLSDRIGRKRAMLLGMSCYVLGAAIEVSVPTPGLILGAAFISGAGQSLFFLSQAPFMMKVSNPQNRTLLFSLNFGLITLAGAAGNIFAGRLPAVFGNLLGFGAQSAQAYQAVLLTSAAASLLTLIPLALIKEPPSGGDISGAHPTRPPIWRVLTRPITLKLTLPNLLIGFGAASLIPYMNVFFNERHAISDQTLGILFSLLSLTTGVGSIFSPQLEKRLGGKIPAVTATQAVSQVFLLLVGFSPRYPLAAGAFLIRGTLMNMAVPLFDAFSMEQVPETEQGTVNSLRTLAWQIGWTIGPFLSGIVQVRYGFAPLFISTATLYTLATLLTWIFFHKVEPAPHYSPDPAWSLSDSIDRKQQPGYYVKGLKNMDYTTLRLPVTLQEYTWRAITREDSIALNKLLLAVEAQDRRGWVDTLADRERDFTDPESNPATDSLAAFSSDGQLVAYGWVFTLPPGETESISFLDGTVHPAYRGRGLGTFILKWLEQRGRAIQSALPGYQTRSLRMSFPDHLTDNLRLFEQQGFQPARYFYRMRRDLSQPIPECQLPAALRLQTWNSALNAAALQAVNESFEDHWGHIPTDEEHWKVWVIDHEYFHPELSFMVMDGAELAGLSVNKIRAAENESAGIKEGWIQSLGVRRAWRRQGIASALLCTSMLAFKAAGLETAGLTVDTDNLTGALRIYERLGFTVLTTIVMVSKTILPE